MSERGCISLSSGLTFRGGCGTLWWRRVCSGLPGTAIEGAEVVAENMRQLVSDLSIPHLKSEISNSVTISIGVASSQPPVRGRDTPESLLKLADMMLYKAKKKWPKYVLFIVFFAYL